MTTRQAWGILGLSAVLALAGCAGPAQLAFDPAQWDFGTIAPTVPVEQNIVVSNPGRRATEVRVISTCVCLTVEPNEFQLAGGGSASVLLRYDPSEDEGDITMQVIVRSGSGEGRRAGRQVLLAFGRVLPGEAAAGGVAGAEEAAGFPASNPSAQLPQLFFEYFYDPGCKGCELLLVRQMVAAQQELGIRLRVQRHHIDDAAEHREYLRRLKALGVEERAYPSLIFADTVLQGDEEIAGVFQSVLRQELEQTGVAEEP